MAIITYNPTSPGRRVSTVNDYAELTDKHKQPEKSLCERLTKHGGRNHHGKITARHRGGGARRIYRVIDFKRDKDDIVGTVQAIESAGVKVESGEIAMIAQNTVELDASKARQALRLLESLEDLEDTQRVTANFDIPEEVFAEVAG
jgi:ribosomal protein L2